MHIRVKYINQLKLFLRNHCYFPHVVAINEFFNLYQSTTTRWCDEPRDIAMKQLMIILLLMLLVTPVAAQDDTMECEAGFHLIEHALGETCIPEAPQRVVPLDMTIIELMLIADMQPAVSSQLVFDTYAQMHPELETTFDNLLETTPDMGFPPNIEVILSTQPDLIIGPHDFFTESLYPELNAIAPTILYDFQPGDWRSRLIFGGEVLGLSDTVDGLLADYDTRVAELQVLLGDEASDIEISLVRTFPGQIGLVLEGTAAANVLTNVGVSRPEAQLVDYDYVLNVLDGRPELLISQEELQLADGDIIFIFSGADMSELVESPLWNALPAVSDGQSYQVGYYWWGDSLLSAHDMLDDLFMYVADTESENVNPFEEGITDLIEDDLTDSDTEPQATEETPDS